MRRVVVTGMGIVSSIGSNAHEVLSSLREARPGIVRADQYAELGFRCQVHGAPTLDWEEALDRKGVLRVCRNQGQLLRFPWAYFSTDTA